VASKLTAAGRRGLVLLFVVIAAASFGTAGASAAPNRDGHVSCRFGLWDGPG
jgi:hypothetical protein